MNRFPILILTITLAAFAHSIMAALQCPDCGQTTVPYPLSTGPSCGDRAYKVRCHEGTLWFDTLNQSSYMITSINPSTQRLLLRPPGYAHSSTCMSADIGSHGLWLDEDLSFNITTSNTVIKMNCSAEMLLNFDFVCASSSVCKAYIRDNKEAANACAMAVAETSNICCSYKAGYSVTAYRIRASPDRCTMYESFVNLDPTLPVSKWPEPGIEIQWALPIEPVCKSSQDCKDLPDSSCLTDPVKDGRKRCFCKHGYKWNPIKGVCHSTKCHLGQRCEVPEIIEGFGLAAIIILLGVIIAFIIRKRRQSIQIGPHIKLKKAREGPDCEQP